MDSNDSFNIVGVVDNNGDYPIGQVIVALNLTASSGGLSEGLSDFGDVNTDDAQSQANASNARTTTDIIADGKTIKIDIFIPPEEHELQILGVTPMTT